MGPPQAATETARAGLCLLVIHFGGRGRQGGHEEEGRASSAGPGLPSLASPQAEPAVCTGLREMDGLPHLPFPFHSCPT